MPSNVSPHSTSASSAAADFHRPEPPAVHGAPGEGGVGVPSAVLEVLEAVPTGEHLVSKGPARQIRSRVTPRAHGVQFRVGAVHTHVCRVFLRGGGGLKKN